ncbi:MAG: ATP-binding cassette domain-containing protein [Eubacteriales bacterium]|nr:ATP-binding cassette domain-containing protein [Eubacteriales bacterium]
MNYHIKINNLNFGYSEKKILDDISITIQKGTFLSIIGPNGSGKSTLLKNIAKNLEPQSGEIWLETLDLLKLPPVELAKKMAVVPQTFQIDFPFTAMETVLMGRTPFLKRFQSETEKDFTLAKWAMELTNTWHLKDRSVTEVSGGELQRIIVARALTQEPKIILLDEPTAHLDIQHQMELLELLESLNKTTGLTVVTVLHDLNLASQFSEEVIMMKDGKIFASGKTSEVLNAENIRAVYEMEVLLAENPLNQKFNIIPLARSKNINIENKNIIIHIICGGGTGIYLIDRLQQLGYSLSAGVLNIGDSDWSKGKKAGIKIIEEAPFAKISEKTINNNLEAIFTSDLVVVTPIPFGMGNLPNLEMALSGAEKGKKVIIIKNNDPLLNQDFTNGKAKDILEKMETAGAEYVENYFDFFEYLESHFKERL